MGNPFATGFFGTLGDKLQEVVKKRNDEAQKLKDQLATVWNDVIKRGGYSNSEGADNSDSARSARIDQAKQELQKMYGKSKPLKEVFDKFGKILHLVHPPDQGQGEGAPQAGGQPQGQPATSAAKPQGLPAPPGNPMSETTPIGGSSTQLPPPPGASASQAAPSAAKPAAAKPFSIADAALANAPMTPEQQADREIALTKRREQGAFAMRQEFADKIGLQQGSRDRQEYIATGKFPAGARLQKMNYIDPQDKTRTPKAGSYDPSSGEYLDQEGRIVPGAVPATGTSQPKPIHYLSPDGKPLFGFQVGMKLYDQEGQELPAGTEFYTRGMLPTQTLRQVITYDADGNPQINTLETMRTPLTGGDAKRAQNAAKQSSGANAGGTAGGGRPKSGGLPAPPSSGAGGGATDATGKPLGMSSGMYNQTTQRIIPVREAATQILGDPTQPNLKSLKDFAYLADDPEAKKRVANALRLTFDGLEQQEKAAGSLTSLLKNYSGVPQALVASQTAVMQDVLGKLTPDELEAYNAAMSSYGALIGLRSLTKASAAQFSVSALERELPLPGINSMNSKQYYNQLSRLAEEVYSGSRSIPFPPEEKAYYKKQVDELQGLAKGKNDKLTAPPANLSKAARDYLHSLGINP